jgi:hypothetical protein
MRKTAVMLVCSVLSTAVISAQQGRGGQTPAGPPPTLVAEVQAMFNNLKRYITAAADQFPEDKYSWSPTPDVRTWAALMGHIADDNNGSCFLLAGETERPARFDQGGKLVESAASFKKADVVRVLNESFARCDKAFAALTPENMSERLGTNNNRSKIGALIYDTQHISEHYGNIVTYMRLQNMVPPSTAGTGRGRGGF